MKKVTARFYRTLSGQEPVREWLNDFSKEDKKIIGADIQTVEFGWPIGMPVCKPLGAGLYEIRSFLSSSRIARTFFCMSCHEIILLHGFIKKSQKTPSKEIDTARKRMKGHGNG